MDFFKRCFNCLKKMKIEEKKNHICGYICCDICSEEYLGLMWGDDGVYKKFLKKIDNLKGNVYKIWDK